MVGIEIQNQTLQRLVSNERFSRFRGRRYLILSQVQICISATRNILMSDLSDIQRVSSGYLLGPRPLPNNLKKMAEAPSPPRTLAHASAGIVANTLGSATVSCMASALTNRCEGRSTALRRPFPRGLEMRLTGSYSKCGTRRRFRRRAKYSPSAASKNSIAQFDLPSRCFTSARHQVPIPFNPAECHQIPELILTTPT